MLNALADMALCFLCLPHVTGKHFNVAEDFDCPHACLHIPELAVAGKLARVRIFFFKSDAHKSRDLAYDVTGNVTW